MENSRMLCNGSFLSSAFTRVVENSLKKEKSNNNRRPSSSVSKISDSSPAAEWTLNTSELELNIDPSYFMTLAHVRRLVLRDQDATSKKETNLLKLLPNSNMDKEHEEQLYSDGNTNKETLVTPAIPQVVVISLRSIFDLIQESRKSYPELCMKVLKALLGILQNLLPETLANEPSDVVEPLFQLLLEMATATDADEGTADTTKADAENCLSSVASSCLLSLVIAWAVTPKILQALDCLITTARPMIAAQEITLPNIMVTLQKGIQAMVIATASIPDWFAQGILRTTLVTSFSALLQGQPSTIYSVACDGSYIYLLSSSELSKIGTGFGGTVGGQVYSTNKDALPLQKGDLLFSNGQLLLQSGTGEDLRRLIVLDRETLTVEKIIELPANTKHSSMLFSDGNLLGSVFKTEEDELVASLIEIKDNVAFLKEEQRLRLARQSLYAVGTSSYEASSDLRQLYLSTDDGFCDITAGKEFALMTTASGKILYQGKPSSLGIKSASSEQMANHESPLDRWQELPLPKGATIVRCVAGHEGLHALAIDANGVTSFVGLARRGEDGDLTKHRRQSKISRPKRFGSMEGKIVIAAACNNGTSALVTKEGELYLFGKDSTYCDASTGRLLDISTDTVIVSVALGKAHGVALTDKGQVYTFGINNKGQCGRDGALPLPVTQSKRAEGNAAQAEAISPPNCMDPDASTDTGSLSEDGGSAAEVKLCPLGEHHWTLDQCMICTHCHQCTGFGSTCVNTNNPGRLPGTSCGCGSGDAGCSRCGACRSCARDPNGARPEALGLPPAPVPILPFGRGNGPIPANGAVLIGRFVRGPVHAFSNAAIVANFRASKRELDEHKDRDGGHVEPLIGAAFDGNRRQHKHSSHRRRHPSEVKVAMMARDMPKGLLDPRKGHQNHHLKGGPEFVPSSDGDREANSKLASLSPGLVRLDEKVRISQVACGLHHSVLLTTDGQVYTFGSNSYGQLGLGDLSPRGTPTLAKIPTGVKIVMIAAGSHHSAALTRDGEVITWGAHSKGQLARDAFQSESGASPADLWYSVPDFVTQIGPRCGKKTSWIGASGDQTFFKIDESLVSEKQFHQSTVLASNHHFVILPTNAKSCPNLVINRQDGQCHSFCGPEQVEFTGTKVTWDPVYGILWSIDSSSVVKGYNACASGYVHTSAWDSLLPACNELEPIHVADVFRPPLALPVTSPAKVTQTQAALHLLCCLDSLSRCQQLPLKDMLTPSQDCHQTSMKNRCYTKEDFSVVNRFESHGGGWGYSGHSVEAIRFMSDGDVLLGGFSLFGGRGEYMGKIKVFDLGMSGGDHEGDGELLAESDEVVYECGARQRYPILFSQPVRLQANRWYLAWARVNGPSSDCGSGGQSSVTTEDQVTFVFKPSKKSNNGTDVNAGQLPQILYRLVAHDAPPSKQSASSTDNAHCISQRFSRMITPDSFHALLNLIQWAWSVLKMEMLSNSISTDSGETTHEFFLGMAEIQDASRVVFVCRASLRLLRFYLLELYPPKSKHSSSKTSLENAPVAQAIVSVRSMLRSILSDPILSRLKKSPLSSEGALPTTSPYISLLEHVAQESHDTFVSCFHIFFPTPALKWTILCELLDQVQKVGGIVGSSDRLLGAVLDSLCSLHLRLRSALPSLCDLQETLLSRQIYQTPEMEKLPSLSSPSENGLTSPVLQMDAQEIYPILVEHMVEGQSFLHRPCRAVLDRLFLIATWPVRQALEGDDVAWSEELVHFACRLLARVVAELVSQVSSIEELEVSATRIVQATPSRFTSVSQNRSWNTGSGSPDAICFTVDRPSIHIVGVGVFGGGGNFHYELELLELMRSSGDSAQTLSWHSLAVVRGTYGPEDCVNDVAEIKFDRPVLVKEGTRYTLRLRNQGGKTLNGDGGIATVKGPDGTSFNFSACLLSFNGTNHIRGQLPYILYCSIPSNSEVQQSMLSAMESQARKSVISITSSIVRCTSELLSVARALPVHQSLPVVANSQIISYLLPYVLANIGVVAETDPRNAVHILELIRLLLPHVSALCLADIVSSKSQNGDSTLEEEVDDSCITTSSHIVCVESEHPYRPATVSHYRACFSETVRWMCLEFDSQCCTIQAEDTLQLYIPSSRLKTHGFRHPSASCDYLPVFSKFSGSDNWPASSLILPGNEVLFSLETASDYVRGDKVSAWGFRCSVTGYEWPETGNAIRFLETELACLGGMCAAALMKRDLSLPTPNEEVDVESTEAVVQHVYTQHSSLLGKGLALSHLPTVHEALEGNLPISISGKERQFLRDFVSASEETSGGRLARWLQPESVLDPSKSQLLFPGVFSANIATFGPGLVGATPCSPVTTNSEVNEKVEGSRLSASSSKKTTPTTTAFASTVVSEGLRAGWPSILTLLTRDQYGHLVHVPNLKVDIRAVPFDSTLPLQSDNIQPKIHRLPNEKPTIGEQLNLTLDTPYEVTIKERMCLHAITFLKAYEDYSFEELRFMSPTKRRTSETMLVRSNADGSYSANWTPSAFGRYTIYVTIDGYLLDQVYEVDVKEPPQGVLPPTHHVTVRNSAMPNNRLRQFRARASAGLRVRAQPSLQGEQIGVVACEGTITFVEELCNDDGTWLRLSMESVREWCYSQYSEAWCLQYNQHLGKTLLFPVSSADCVTNEATIDNVKSQDKKESDVLEATTYPSAQTFYVVNCGPSGHNIRAQPSLKAQPVGKLKLGSSFFATEWRQTVEGCWVKLLPSSASMYGSSGDEEAWSLAVDRHHVVYLRRADELLAVLSGPEKAGLPLPKPALDFSDGIDLRTSLSDSLSSDPSTTFMFGPERHPERPRTPSRITPPRASEPLHEVTAIPPDAASNQELDSSQVNSSQVLHAKETSVEQSTEDTTGTTGTYGPLAAAAVGRLSAFQNWLRRDGSTSKEPPSKEPSNSPPRPRNAVPPELQGVSVKDLVRVMGESRSNGNASPPSSPNMSRKSGAASVATSRSLSAHEPAMPLKVEESLPPSELTQRSRSPATQAAPSCSSKNVSSPAQSANHEAGTQTSPETSKEPPFSLGFDLPHSTQRLSPKATRTKDRSAQGGVKTRKARSPTVGTQHVADRASLLEQETARLGISPSTAECLRAVFAANLWHQGLVHDAMACASFLKFHPNLPKQIEAVILRGEQRNRKSREDKVRQRHSVEILSSVMTSPYASALPVALEENSAADRAECTASLSQPTPNESKGNSSLTPTLSLLVELWEKLSEYCVEMIQTEAVVQSNALGHGQVYPDGGNTKSKGSLKVDGREARDKERKRKSRKESIRPESNCELCGAQFPLPVTAHMRQAHPGCQKPAQGLGYNLSGHYCGGWVGNCGEGGLQGSAWYLLCEDCRHRYLQQRRQVGEAFGVKDGKSKRLRRKVSSSPFAASSTQLLHPSIPIEAHMILKENALFLLDLTSSCSPEKNQAVFDRRRKSLMHQPSLSAVSEDPSMPHRKISAPPPKTECTSAPDTFHRPRFQCVALLRSNCNPEFSNNETAFGDIEIFDHSFEAEPESKVSPDGLGRHLHRSISMITQPLAEHLLSEQSSSPNGTSSQRRRTASVEEQGVDGGLALLRSPSKALQDTVKLLSSWADQDPTNRPSPLPVLDFVTRRHDLVLLRSSMELALRKAACRVFAMENLSWLLQRVTQPVCLHDLLWWLVSSLAPSTSIAEWVPTKEQSEFGAGTAKKDNLVGQHPTTDVALAGEGLSPLLQSFHGLLQTVSNLMQLLPMGTPLLTMAVRCWDIRFKQSDHSFLHKSHVFSNISRILSRCEEEIATDIEVLENHAVPLSDSVTVLADVMDGVDIKVSSRSAMVKSLTDGSTETFWESGDEDRGKTKLLTITLSPESVGCSPRVICIFVDNGRDAGSKVSGVTIKVGNSTDELEIVEVMELESRFAGWLHSYLPSHRIQVIQLELKGPDNSLRIRQVRLLGGGISRSFNSSAVHQRTCETETLRVFRLLTSQVFGRLVSSEGDSSPSRPDQLAEVELDASEATERTQDIDLKEHMVGILFSGKKLTALTHLQRQVCTHILHGIQRETIRLRDEWEALLQLDETPGVEGTCQDAHFSSRISDSYCFELLSQVLALSGSRVGRTYISQQTTLPADLLSLLHTGSPRIQRQVTALLRRMLPELPPTTFASLVGVDVLPAAEYGILQVLNSTGSAERVGILDVFLACVAKALTLQMKIKGRDKESSKSQISSGTMSSMFNSQKQHEQLGARWWMRGKMSRRVAESIIQLVRDMASGNLSEMWAAVTKASIAEAVLALTKLDEERRRPAECLETPSLWLTLAALCLLEDEHVERLSSSTLYRGTVNKPYCANHDDGETGAQIVCVECGPLCIDCERVLHLSRKFRNHQRQVCKEEEEAIKVDVHEGCGRVKLFWILALSDARNLKSLVEFRHGAHGSSSGLIGPQAVFVDGAGLSSTLVGGISASACRYCGSPISPSTASLFDDYPINVCNEPECQEHSRNACTKIHPCGHPCGGVRDESECLPCLSRCSGDGSLKQDADDMCMICFTEALSAAPAIQLTCKHVFHAHCCRSVLSKKWPGPRITFGFSCCPICKTEMQHDYLADELAPIRELFNDVKRKALMRLEYEGLHQSEAILIPGSRFYQDPAGFAMERYAYYVCFKCNKAYYGGEARCEAELGAEGGGPAAGPGGDSFNPAELVCGGCSDVSRAQMCPRHGADYLEYKCRYCCSVAIFFCFGTTHFCNACHEDFRHVTEMPKHALPKCPAGPRGRQLDGDECPLHLVHPPTGEEFALGCGICRNAHTF